MLFRVLGVVRGSVLVLFGYDVGVTTNHTNPHEQHEKKLTDHGIYGRHGKKRRHGKEERHRTIDRDGEFTRPSHSDIPSDAVRMNCEYPDRPHAGRERSRAAGRP